MPFFNVVIHGRCLPKATVDGPQPRGFYVPRFVWAASPTAARAKALAWIAKSPKALRIAAQFDSPIPTFAIDSIAEIPWYRYLRGQPGWVLYDESEPAPADTRVA